jgi:hypothetical protein
MVVRDFLDVWGIRQVQSWLSLKPAVVWDNRITGVRRHRTTLSGVVIGNVF